MPHSQKQTTTEGVSLLFDFMWAINYIGKKWTPEFNCWEFAKLILEKEKGFDVSTALDAIANPLSIGEVGLAISIGLSQWQKVEIPEEFDICIMGKKDIVNHIGICINQRSIIHSNKGMLSCCADILLDLKGKYKTIEFYRYAKDNTSKEST
jgi:hypothetical protein